MPSLCSFSRLHEKTETDYATSATRHGRGMTCAFATAGICFLTRQFTKTGENRKAEVPRETTTWWVVVVRGGQKQIQHSINMFKLPKRTAFAYLHAIAK